MERRRAGSRHHYESQIVRACCAHSAPLPCVRPESQAAKMSAQKASGKGRKGGSRGRPPAIDCPAAAGGTVRAVDLTAVDVGISGTPSGKAMQPKRGLIGLFGRPGLPEGS
jgi:hypothetical protein